MAAELPMWPIDSPLLMNNIAFGRNICVNVQPNINIKKANNEISRNKQSIPFYLFHSLIKMIHFSVYSCWRNQIKISYFSLNQQKFRLLLSFIYLYRNWNCPQINPLQLFTLLRENNINLILEGMWDNLRERRINCLSAPLKLAIYPPIPTAVPLFHFATPILIPLGCFHSPSNPGPIHRINILFGPPS